MEHTACPFIESILLKAFSLKCLNLLFYKGISLKKPLKV